MLSVYSILLYHLCKKRILCVILIIVLSAFATVGCGNQDSTPNSDNSKETNSSKGILFDAPSYSGISKSDLFKKFGETSDIFDFQGTLTIYSYDDKDNNHYEFAIANDTDSVVKVIIESAKYKTDEGTYFKYTNKSVDDLLSLFNITPNDSAELVDTGDAYKISSVSDNLDEIWIYGFGEDSTFKSVTITYDMSYFD